MDGHAAAVALIGRDDEVATLRACLERAIVGDGHLCVLVGEAGIGKSRLVTATVDAARTMGFRVWAGATEQLGWDRPFGPLLSALTISSVGDSSPVGELLRLAADEHRRPLLAAAIPEARFQLVDALGEVVEKATHEGPLLLVVEDLHHADPSTFLAVRSIVRRAVGLPLLVLATTRPPLSETASHGVATMLEAGSTPPASMVQLELAPLTEADARALVEAVVGGRPGTALMGLVHGAAGNPLLITELVGGLARGGSLVVNDSGVVEAATTALPEQFTANVHRQLNALDAETRGVLRLAAVLGSTITVSELAIASGRTAADLMERIDDALRAGVLAEVDGRLIFRHELVRVAVYEQVPENVRRAVHLDVARAMAAGGGSLLRVATHYSLGAEVGDAEAIGWLHRAGRSVITSSPEMAIELLDHAVRLAGPVNAAERIALLSTRLEALVLGGRLQEASEACAELQHAPGDASTSLELRRRIAAAMLLTNRIQDAATELEKAAGPDSADSLAEAGVVYLFGGMPDSARSASERALALARVQGAVAAESLALCVLSRVESFTLDLRSAVAVAVEGLSAADRDPTGEAHRHQPLLFTGLAHHDLDDLGATAASIAAGRQVADSRGFAFAEPLYLGLSAFTHLRAGRLSAARDEATDGVRRCDELGTSLALAWCSALLSLTALHQNDIDVASEAAGTARRGIADGPGLLGYDLVALASALVHEDTGDLDAALASLREPWDLFAGLDVPTLSAVIGPDLVRLAVATDDVELASRVAATLGSMAERAQVASWTGAALAARARIASDLVLARHAVEAYRQSPRVLALAGALELAADLADPPETGLLQEAFAIYDGCGALRDANRTAASLRSLGARVVRHSASPSTTDLTPSEHDVARLVAAGLTNREVAARLFVSPRTVETHLYRIFAKLGIRSRVELAVMLGKAEP